MKEKLSSKLEKILFFILAFGLSIIMLYIPFKDFNWSFEGLLQILLNDTLFIVISLLFMGFIIYVVKTTTVKKKIVCKLKDIIDLRNIDEIYSFELQFEYQNRTFSYNTKDNLHPYSVGNNYVVVVRNHVILSVLPEIFQGPQKSNNKNNYWDSTYMPDGSYVPFNILIIFYILTIVFLAGIVDILINIFANNLVGQDLINNMISLIVCIVVFIGCAWCIFNDYQKKKEGSNNNE